MGKIIAIFIVALALLGAEPSYCAADPIKAVATTSIIGDWVKIVGGDRVNVTILVGPDGDPHDYQPTPADNIMLNGANLIFENGLGLETWMDKMYASAQSGAKRVVVTDGIEVRHVSPAEGSQADGKVDDRDPHAWQNVRNAQQMVVNICQALSQADPTHAAEYKSRSEDYSKQLASLDSWIASQIATIPPVRRKLVTSHDAFGYFGTRYGIDVMRSALESVTTETSDPSARQMVDVIEYIKASSVPVIFVENVQNRKLIDRIAQEANVRVGPPLYSDALGQPGTDGETYLKMMRYNTETLVKALSQ